MIKQWGKKIEQQYHFLEFNDAMKPETIVILEELVITE